MKYSKEQMDEIYQRWMSSGMSRKAFCKQSGIAYGTFQYWCKRIMPDSEGSGFKELVVEPVSGVCLEVFFPSGARIIFQGEPSASWLRELVS